MLPGLNPLSLLRRHLSDWRLCLLAVPAASLCTPGCPLTTCCAPDIPLQLAFSPLSCRPLLSASAWPVLGSPARSCPPSCTSILLLCFLPPPSQKHCPFLFLGRASATLALLLQLLSAELCCGREAYHALIGAIGNLWAPIAVGRAALHAVLSRPSSAVSPITPAAPLGLCRSH